jgi:hypothetical protein
MNKIFLTLVFLSFSICLFSQLTKKNWLLGGTGTLTAYKSTSMTTLSTQESNELNLKINPTIGYFVTDKFVLGLKPFLSWFKSEIQITGGSIISNVKRYGIGPFARYYFLPNEKQINIITEVSYQHGFFSFAPQKGNSDIFSFLVGPVVYFNSSVGLEFLVGYSSRKENINQGGSNTTYKGLDIGIGFQFYLEKK